ncbi:unnamed protein product [Sphenostylis stenocarpa]|uniref:Uncharacterized protein n=1 Tax=Sphenostylis stenocarpa TaxID=92480 RepID=A0AA86VBP5_9FABA|nr:unnamed protein product [Sphenostylis stenocarpa]
MTLLHRSYPKQKPAAEEVNIHAYVSIRTYGNGNACAATYIRQTIVRRINPLQVFGRRISRLLESS